MTTHIHLAPRLKISGATPLFPPSAFMVWTGFCIFQNAEMEVKNGAVIPRPDPRSLAAGIQ